MTIHRKATNDTIASTLDNALNVLCWNVEGLRGNIRDAECTQSRNRHSFINGDINSGIREGLWINGASVFYKEAHRTHEEEMGDTI